jgi:hypothetical protein
MTLQTIQFESISLAEVGSGTITAFLFSGATLSATLADITENGTLRGRYTGTVTSIAAGDYRLVVKYNDITISEPNEAVSLLLAVGTYVATAAAELDSAAQSMVTAFNAMRSGNVFTAPALANAPSGGSGGGDWSDTEKAQIRYRLGLDGTATAPSDPDGETITIDPGSSNITTGYATCLDVEGQAQSSVRVYAQLIEAASSSTGFAFDASQSSVLSASNGVAQMPLIKGATYLIWRGKQDTGRPITVPSDAGSTYALPSLVGY